MTDHDLLDPGANWCPDCGLPRGVCDCDEADGFKRLATALSMFVTDARDNAQRFAHELDAALAELDEENAMSDYLLSFSGETPAAPPDAPMGVMAVCPACDGLGLDKADEEPCPHCNGDGYLYPM